MFCINYSGLYAMLFVHTVCNYRENLNFCAQRRRARGGRAKYGQNKPRTCLCMFWHKPSLFPSLFPGSGKTQEIDKGASIWMSPKQGACLDMSPPGASNTTCLARASFLPCLCHAPSMLDYTSLGHVSCYWSITLLILLPSGQCVLRTRYTGLFW